MLELKFLLSPLSPLLVISLNRTMLELKWFLYHAYIAHDALSIVPCWNWNFFVYFVRNVASLSQSYHVGIEIVTGVADIFWVVGLSIVPCWNWNIVRRAWPILCQLSQSYHVGIEIFAAVRLLTYQQSLNRTMLELKLCWVVFGWRLWMLSQSYHVGIEIAG